jgi:4'-phosphopantetheinyl transferase
MLPANFQTIVSPFGDIELWAVWIRDLVLCRDALIQLLSAEEKCRLAKISDPQRQQEFISGRGGLRLLLGHYEHISPESCIISYHSGGKPYLQNSNWQFNLSHSCGLIIYGFAQDWMIGVDVEYQHRSVNYQKVSLRYFGNRYDRDEFWQRWTQKEAIGKALGKGLQNKNSDGVQVKSWQIFGDYQIALALGNLSLLL